MLETNLMLGLLCVLGALGLAAHPASGVVAAGAGAVGVLMIGLSQVGYVFGRAGGLLSLAGLTGFTAWVVWLCVHLVRRADDGWTQAFLVGAALVAILGDLVFGLDVARRGAELREASNRASFRMRACEELERKRQSLVRSWRVGEQQAVSLRADSGDLEFSFADGFRVSASGQLLGTYDPARQRWRWAWRINRPDLKRLPRVSAEVERAVEDALAGKRITTVAREELSSLVALGVKAAGAAGDFIGKVETVDPELELAFVLGEPRRS